MTRQAVAKHLLVLDQAGLVHGTTAGRERRYQVDQAQLARAVAQLASVGASWDARLQRIKRIAEAIQRERDADGDALIARSSLAEDAGGTDLGAAAQ